MPRPTKSPASSPSRSLFRRKPKSAADGPGALSRIMQAYKVGRKHDRFLLLWPVVALLVPIAIGVGVGFATGWIILAPIIGAVIGVLAGLNVFFYRAQRGLYAEHAGTPGVAIQVLRNLRGDWKITEAVQFNRSQELVHRLVGRPGVVLIAEGRSANVRQLLATEARRTRRIAPDVTVHEIVVGDRDGEVPLIKLRGHVSRLRRTLRKPEIRALDIKLKAVANTNVPIPKGPLPTRIPRGKMR